MGHVTGWTQGPGHVTGHSQHELPLGDKAAPARSCCIVHTGTSVKELGQQPSTGTYKLLGINSALKGTEDSEFGYTCF